MNKKKGVPTTADNLSFKQQYIKNERIWRVPDIRKEGFQFFNQILPDGLPPHMDLDRVKLTIDEFGMGEYESIFPERMCWEWDYCANHITFGGVADWIYPIIEDGYKQEEIKTRSEALKKLQDFLLINYRLSDEKYGTYCGHYPYQHYSAEFGSEIIGSEIGENMHNIQMQIAFSRGAARQYQKPWVFMFSYWHANSLLDYVGAKIEGVSMGPDCGHSINLYERAMIASYMANVKVFGGEAAGNTSVTPRKEGACYVPSAAGEVNKKFVEFTKNHPDVGISYTPVALVLDYYHGSYLGLHYEKEAFGRFAYTQSDYMTYDLMDALWPGAWQGKSSLNESNVMTNSTFGDYFDVLLQNTSDEVLNSYYALIFSGDIKLSPTEKKRYTAYVKQGGTLVLNSAYIDQFPEYKLAQSRKSYELIDENGRVIVYFNNFDIANLLPIIEEIISKTVPFHINQNILHMLNINDEYMYLTLINNEGITKLPTSVAEIDNAKAKDVVVSYTGEKPIKAIKNIYSDDEISFFENEIKVTVPAGGCVVLKCFFN